MFVASSKFLKNSFKSGIKIISSNCSTNKSTLLVSGRFRNTITPPVEPYIDREKLSKSELLELELSLNLRDPEKIDSISVVELLKALERLDKIESEETKLNLRKDEIKQLYSQTKDKHAHTNLAEEAKTIKKTLKELRMERWSLEETELVEYLRMPNYLQKQSTVDEDIVVEEIGQKPLIDHNTHVKSHKHLYPDDIEFSDSSPTSYYLLNDVAMLEMSLMWAAQKFLLAASLDMYSGPDFTRTYIVEGCNPETSVYSDSFGKDEVFSLAETSDFGDISSMAATHLVGSASLESLIGNNVKNIIINPNTSLPKTYFCCGRKYKPLDYNQHEEPSLYNTQQSTAIEFICLSKSSSSMEDQINYMKSITSDFYKMLDLPCRFVLRHPGSIGHSAKSMKISILIYSQFLKDYIEVGHLGVYNDFLSKRLLLLCEDIDGLKELHIVSGTFMDVTKMIACVIEHCQVYGSLGGQATIKDNIEQFISKLSSI